ncbi:MAG: MATE family efflux transporter [Tissierellia bacterium]|nr:MATE family efflux transporter [Tissierellia bacterium]
MKLEAVDLTKGEIWKQLIIFTIPLLMSALLQQFYSTADLLIVGRFSGEIDMAAIGNTGPLVNLLVSLFIGLSTGVSVIVATFYSARNRQRTSEAVHTTYAIAIFGGLAFTVFTYALAPTFLRWMGTPDAIISASISYLRITFLGNIPVLIYNMGSGILRSVGDSVRPFNFLAVAAFLNIVFDLILVGLLDMGAAGAGWATMSAQFVSAFLVTRALMETTDIFKLSPGRIRFYREAIVPIVKIGLPVSIQGALISLSNVIIQGQINTFGPQAIAGISAAGRIDGFIFLAMEAFAIAATTFVSQNIGARKLDRLKRGMGTSVVMVTIATVSLTSLIVLFRNPLMALFNSDPDVISYGARMLLILGPGYIIFGVNQVVNGFIRGSGKSLPLMVVSLISMFAIRLAFIFFGIARGGGIDIIYWSYPLSWTCNTLLVLAYYFFGNWKPKILEEAEDA